MPGYRTKVNRAPCCLSLHSGLLYLMSDSPFVRFTASCSTARPAADPIPEGRDHRTAAQRGRPAGSVEPDASKMGWAYGREARTAPPAASHREVMAAGPVSNARGAAQGEQGDTCRETDRSGRVKGPECSVVAV